MSRRQWRTLLGCSIGACLAYPTLGVAIFGQLVLPMSAALSRSPQEVGLAYSVMSVVGILVPPIAGAAIDRFGVRFVSSLSAAAMAFVFLGLSGAGSLTSILTLYGLLALAGGGTLPLAYSRPIVAAFRQNLGLALGLMLAASAVAVAAAPILVVTMIRLDGVRGTFLVLAGLAAVGSAVAALLIRSESPADAAEASDRAPFTMALGQARTAVGMKMLAMALLLGAFTGGVWSQVVPMLASKGIEPKAAAYTMAGVALMSAITRVFAGFALDRFFAPFVGGAIMVPVMTGWLALAFVDANWVVVGSVVLFGMGLGLEIDLFSYLTSKYMPSAAYSSFYGILFSIMFLGGALAAPLTTLAVRLTGGAFGAPLAFAFVVGAALLVMLFLPRYRTGDAGEPAFSALP